jgi:hypothetical protein
MSSRLAAKRQRRAERAAREAQVGRDRRLRLMLAIALAVICAIAIAAILWLAP